MHDSSILVFNLIYAGTLGIGLLMFLGQLGALIVLLVSAATAKVLAVALAALFRRTRKSAPHLRLRGRHFSRVTPAADAFGG